MTRPLVLVVMATLLTACGSPPVTDPSPRAATPTNSPVTAAPRQIDTSPTVDRPPVVLPSPREPDAPTPIEAKDAAEAMVIKAALERAARPGSVPPTREPAAPRTQRVPSVGSVSAEALSERDLAAAREALPALQERMGHVIQRSFDAESFRQLLTTHPEFRKD